MDAAPLPQASSLVAHEIILQCAFILLDKFLLHKDIIMLLTIVNKTTTSVDAGGSKCKYLNLQHFGRGRH